MRRHEARLQQRDLTHADHLDFVVIGPEAALVAVRVLDFIVTLLRAAVAAARAVLYIRTVLLRHAEVLLAVGRLGGARVAVRLDDRQENGGRLKEHRRRRLHDSAARRLRLKLRTQRPEEALEEAPSAWFVL